MAHPRSAYADKTEVPKFSFIGECAVDPLYLHIALCHKRDLARLEQELGDFQREAGKNRDSENARFFKEEMKEVRKQLRAVRVLVGHVCSLPAPADCPYVDLWDFAEELFPAMSAVLRHVEVTAWVESVVWC